jgi:hypothetical protein
MYATSADWSFDALPDDFQSSSNDFPAEIKSMGALSFFMFKQARPQPGV